KELRRHKTGIGAEQEIVRGVLQRHAEINIRIGKGGLVHLNCQGVDAWQEQVFYPDLVTEARRSGDRRYGKGVVINRSIGLHIEAQDFRFVKIKHCAVINDMSEAKDAG